MKQVPLRHRRVQVALVVVLACVTALVAARAATAGSGTPSTGDARPVAAFIGDSSTEGAGASTAGRRWSSLVSKAMGWREVNFARAETGYAASSSQQFCGRPVCPPFADMIDQVAALNPDIVVVAGGQGDWLAWDSGSDRVSALIDDFFAVLRKRVPEARIVVVGPLEPPGAAHEATVDRIAARVREVAEARKFVYVDLLNPNVLDRGDLLADNHFDPNDAGHRAVAQRIVEALR